MHKLMTWVEPIDFSTFEHLMGFSNRTYWKLNSSDIPIYINGAIINLIVQERNQNHLYLVIHMTLANLGFPPK